MAEEYTRPAGMNCAQAVAHYGLHVQGKDSPELMHALQGFGTGMECGKVCGCLVGGVAALGLARPDGDAAGTRTQVQALVRWFEAQYGNTECNVLKHPQHPGEKPVSCRVLMDETAKQCAALLRQGAAAE